MLAEWIGLVAGIMDHGFGPGQRPGVGVRLALLSYFFSLVDKVIKSTVVG